MSATLAEAPEDLDLSALASFLTETETEAEEEDGEDETAETAKGKRGRKQVWASEADRKKAHRDREKVLKSDVLAVIEALIRASERGRSTRLTNHLPEDLTEKLRELRRRLDASKIIAARHDAR